MGIDKFFDSKRQSVVERAEKLTRGKTKKDQREIERKLLKPATIPTYCGEVPGSGPVESRTIKIICKSQIDVGLVKKYFKVSEYKGLNIRDVSLLMSFLEALENGGLEYDAKEQAISFVDDQGARVRL
jgi:hypothetical protein